MSRYHYERLKCKMEETLAAQDWQKLFESVKHLPLHPVLQLAPSDHVVDDLLDDGLGVLLLHEVFDD